MAWIDSVSCTPANNSNALNPQHPPSFAAELQAAQARVVQSQTADITIVTAQGDTVTLSSSRSAELAFSTYNAHGQVGGTSVEFHRESAISLSVEGDLNKEELKDIRRAIRTIHKAESDVLKGHEEKAGSRTAKLAGLDQITSIEAKLEFDHEVSVTRIAGQSESAPLPESTEISNPDRVSDVEPQGTEAGESVSVAETASPAVSIPATASTTISASTHVLFILQTQNNAVSASTADSPQSGLWWFPSADLWNTLNSTNGTETSAAA